ncbi:MupA/Atu3671 family FMN-dependent luciferase-like monooxygenase [Streptomyces sp. NPDC005438]|uniref:MupA/Atu3671 family FMN-dependent luciferase-like monooxygenase n=1 Tax=Streptomyces sp. NPDC005438 TaxID=3156880 RepID=UPI0033A1C9FF
MNAHSPSPLAKDLATLRELTERVDRQLARLDGVDQPPPEAPSAPADQPPARTGTPTATSHGPRVTVSRDASMAGDTGTRDHLDELVRRYTARTPRSKELARRHRAVLADARASVGFRSATKEMLYPLAGRRASGAHLEDVDGNRYVDITMGFGVLLFGHEPDFVTEAVREHLAGGIRLGPRGPETGEVAQLVSELTGHQRVAFAGSGTEANAAAIRLARAATGRNKVVTFHGSYHGHADGVLGRSVRGVTVPISSGIPDSAVSELIVLDYGEPDSLQAIEERAGEIAVVLVEPVQSRNPSLVPVEFVQRLRSLTARHGIVLLFDEMLTGFRLHPRGAQELYQVTPDLATYGKLLGGGYPIGAIAGRADILDGVDGGHWSYGDDSYPPADTTFFGGTYIQHPVSMAAARAVLTHLKNSGPGLQAELSARTQRLADSLNSFLTEEEFPLRVAHHGSMFRFEHRANMELLYHHLTLRGVYVWEWRNFFLSTAHGEEEVERVRTAVVDSLRELRDAGLLPDPRAARTPAKATAPPRRRERDRQPEMSLYFFGDYPEHEQPHATYDGIIEAARFADAHDFHGVWLPERHFHSFGAPFPNPSVLAAALARETSRVRINSGSVVLPLHDPIRVAEEWSMVDQLSGGRVGLGCASGWNARDFVFFPDRFGRHREELYAQIEELRRLWAGTPVRRTGGDGEVEVRVYPRPVQQAPPLFTAIVGNPDSYRRAGTADLGVVTNLMSQSPERLAENIDLYRQARADAGLDPDTGRVVVLLHTYLAERHEDARRAAYEPLARYMRSSMSLFHQVTTSLGGTLEMDRLHEDDLDAVFARAYDRYCDQRALIGSPESCLPVVDRLRRAGVDEVAALVDFGVSPELLRAGLPHLNRLRQLTRGAPRTATDPPVTATARGREPAPNGHHAPAATSHGPARPLDARPERGTVTVPEPRPERGTPDEAYDRGTPTPAPATARDVPTPTGTTGETAPATAAPLDAATPTVTAPPAPPAPTATEDPATSTGTARDGVTLPVTARDVPTPTGTTRDTAPATAAPVDAATLPVTARDVPTPTVTAPPTPAAPTVTEDPATPTGTARNGAHPDGTSGITSTSTTPTRDTAAPSTAPDTSPSEGAPTTAEPPTVAVPEQPATTSGVPAGWDSAPLTPGQRQLWFDSRMHPGRTTYNEPLALRLDGPVDVNALRRALNALVDRHEALRTVFREVDGTPRQLVQPPGAPAEFLVRDHRDTPEADLLEEVMAQESARAFDLARGPLLITRLLRTGEERWLLVFSFHHIVVDAHSSQLIARDLSALYTGALRGEPVALPELAHSCREFATRQSQGADPRVEEDLDYWTGRLAGPPPPLDLPLDHPRPEVATARGRRLRRTVPTELADRIRRLAREERATPFMVLLSGFAAGLHALTGQPDLVIGSPMADRPEGTEELVGYFLNTLPLRLDLDGDPSYRELVGRVRGACLDAYDHAAAPLESVIQRLAPPRDLSRHPLFQVTADYETGEPLDLRLPGVEARQLAIGADKSLMELALYLIDRPEGLDCHLEYNSDLFDPPTMETFLDRLEDTWWTAVADPGLPLSRLGAPDRGPVRPLEDAPVGELVVRQAGRTPEALAVRDRHGDLNYRELERRSARLARRLLAHPRWDRAVPVALWLPRGGELVVAMLAVLRAGGAYLPLDPSLGTQRVDAVLAESDCRLLLVQDGGPPPPVPPAHTEVLSVGDPQAPREPQELPRADLDDPCYVIHTSGSTGRPKGVTVTHRGVANLCQWHRHRFELGPGDRSAQVCSTSFDASVLEIWPALTRGLGVVVAEDHLRLDPPALADWYQRQGVGFSILPTVLTQELLRLPVERQPGRLRYLLAGGEPLRATPPEGAPFELVNVYGPTECAVLVTTHSVPPGAPSPIPLGRPVDNTTLYALDEERRPVPPGTVGQLYVRGAGVASGYLRRPELTDQVFVPPPSGAPGRLYATGDLARQRPDGTWEFHGRTDDQLKISGFRVEPQEVTEVLRELPGVRDALVVGVRDGDEPHLAAYVVPDGTDLPRVAELLAGRLPAYLRPRTWAELPALPLGGTGKVDPAALPPAAPLTPSAPAHPEDDPSLTTASTDAEPPTGTAPETLQPRLRELWATQLRVPQDRVEPDTRYFDLGGDSISVVRLLNRIREEYGFAYPVVDFFRQPTVRAMADRLAAEAPRPVEREAPVSVAQRGMVEVVPTSAIPQLWNVSLRMALTGPLDTAALGRALTALVDRHHALRCRFTRDGGDWTLQVLAPRPVPLPVTDLTDREPEQREEELERLCSEAAWTEFDLGRSTEPVAHLIRTGPQRATLMLVLHHVSVDGWALDLLLRELAELYRAHHRGERPRLTPVALQASDHADWESRHADPPAERERKLAYWRRRMAGVTGPALLPTDHPRPEQPSGRGRTHYLRVDPELPSRIEELARVRGATPYAVTMAALTVLVAHHSGADDQLMSFSYANRGHPELEGLVSCTAHIMGLRLRLDRSDSFGALVDQVTRASMEAVDHRMPMAEVASRLAASGDHTALPARLPMGMTYQNTLDLSLDLDDVRASITDQVVPAARRECAFGVFPKGEGFLLFAEYSTDLWEPATMEGLMTELARILERGCEKPTITLRELIERGTEGEPGVDAVPQADGH